MIIDFAGVNKFDLNQKTTQADLESMSGVLFPLRDRDFAIGFGGKHSYQILCQLNWTTGEDQYAVFRCPVDKRVPITREPKFIEADVRSCVDRLIGFDVMDWSIEAVVESDWDETIKQVETYGLPLAFYKAPTFDTYFETASGD